jgi:hypothetical protein
MEQEPPRVSEASEVPAELGALYLIPDGYELEAEITDDDDDERYTNEIEADYLKYSVLYSELCRDAGVEEEGEDASGAEGQGQEIGGDEEEREEGVMISMEYRSDIYHSNYSNDDVAVDPDRDPAHEYDYEYDEDK